MSSLFCTPQYPSLSILARISDKMEFYSPGTGSHPAHPVTAEGTPAAHLGTGTYSLNLRTTSRVDHRPTLGALARDW
jgi:hypothetical protein